MSIMDADQMAAVLTEREDWDIYRCHDGRFIVRLGKNETERSVDGHSITEALRKAVDSKPLPIVPKQPSLTPRENFTVARDGSKWQLSYRGTSGVTLRHGHLPTKRKALETADLICALNAEDRQAWSEEWGALVSSGTEGVDFVWRSW